LLELIYLSQENEEILLYNLLNNKEVPKQQNLEEFKVQNLLSLNTYAACNGTMSICGLLDEVGNVDITNASCNK